MPGDQRHGLSSEGSGLSSHSSPGSSCVSARSRSPSGSLMSGVTTELTSQEPPTFRLAAASFNWRKKAGLS